MRGRSGRTISAEAPDGFSGLVGARTDENRAMGRWRSSSCIGAKIYMVGGVY